MTISVEFVNFTAREPIQLKMSYWITTAANMFSSAMIDLFHRGAWSAHTRCDSQGLGPAPGGIHATFWLTAVRHSQCVRLHDPFDWPFRRAPRTKRTKRNLRSNRIRHSCYHTAPRMAAGVFAAGAVW